MDNNLTQTIEILAGWDHRNQEEGYHGCEILFILSGTAGAVTFACSTDWSPLPVQQKYMNGIQRTNIIGIQPTPMDFVYHSFKPSNLPQQIKHDDCPYSATGVCYTFISRGMATYLRDILLTDGSEGVWRELGQRYRSAVGIPQNVRRRI